MKPVIFTDLDGTLLDQGYSFAPAAPALARVKEEGVPLVLVTSKTRAEVEVIRAELGNSDPFITENGGGIFIPSRAFPFPVKGEELDGYTLIRLGVPYQDLRLALARVRAESGRGLKGFGDMTDEEVSRITGLPLKEAALARKREFDEPFITEDGSGAEEAGRLVESAGYSFTMDRFFHITGPNDKGKAVETLIALYRSLYGRTATIGLGNAANDASFLKKTDYPVLVMGADGSYNDIGEVPGLIKARGIGPAGWGRAVSGILDSIKARDGYTC